MKMMRIPFFVRWQQQTAQQAAISLSLSCITSIINPELQFLRRTKPRLFSKPFSKPVGSKRLTHNKSRLKWIARFLQIRRFLVDKSFLRGEEENSRRSCSPSGGRSNFLGRLRRTLMNFFGTFSSRKKYIQNNSNGGCFQHCCCKANILKKPLHPDS